MRTLIAALLALTVPAQAQETDAWEFIAGDDRARIVGASIGGKASVTFQCERRSRGNPREWREVASYLNKSRIRYTTILQAPWSRLGDDWGLSSGDSPSTLNEDMVGRWARVLLDRATYGRPRASLTAIPGNPQLYFVVRVSNFESVWDQFIGFCENL